MLAKRLPGLALAGLAIALAAQAQGPRQVKVTVAFQEEATSDQEGVQGSGSVVILGNSGVRGRGGLGASATTTRTRRSSGVFTIVQDGGFSSLSVATRVPFEEVRFYQDAATGAGLVTSGVVFESVGTALRVGARILEGDRILLQLTPTVSWFSADGSGAIDFTEASSELVVEAGKPVLFGGSTRETHDVMRRILGIDRISGRTESSLSVTASIL